MKKALNENKKVFIIYVICQQSLILIHSAKKGQIALLFIKKVIILTEYFDFLNIFSKKKVLVLLEQNKLN